jgi:hypothetical protein
MKSLVSAGAVAALAGSAFGLGETLDRSGTPIWNSSTPGITITKQAVGSHSNLDRQGTTVYDSMGGLGYVASPPASGTLGIEDYGTTLSPSGPPNGTPTTAFDTFHLCEYQFAGGVQQPGGILFMSFFFNNFSFADSFGVSLSQAGNFLWTITIGNPAALNVPTEGFHLLSANTDTNIGILTTGQWFLNTSTFVGHNDGAWDNGSFSYSTTSGTITAPIHQSFEMQVPTPGALALFGVAGLAGIRRRR